MRLIHVMSTDAASQVLVKFETKSLKLKGWQYPTTAAISPKQVFYRNIIPLLLQPITSHLIFCGLFDPKFQEPKKDVDLSAMPRASSSYASRIIQTLGGSNVVYNEISEHQVGRLTRNVSTNDRQPSNYDESFPLFTELIRVLEESATVPTLLSDTNGSGQENMIIPLSNSVVVALNSSIVGSNGSCPDQADMSQLLDSSQSQPLESIRSTGAEVGISTDYVNSDEDLGAAKFRLRCSAGTTHCRIRAKPSLESAEVGDVANAAIIDISGQVGDFYRLADGRGFVKKVVVDAIVWERQDPYKGGANKTVDFLERLLLQELGSLSAWTSYCLLCELLSNWPADFPVAECMSGGILQLLLKVSGLGKLSLNGTSKSTGSKTIASKEIVPKSTPLLASFKRFLLLLGRQNQHLDITVPRSVSNPLSSFALQLTNVASCLFASVKYQALQNKGKAKEVEVLPHIAPIILESSHEYENNTDFVTRIHLPGAAGIEISFDEDTSTEVSSFVIFNIYY